MGLKDLLKVIKLKNRESHSPKNFMGKLTKFLTTFLIVIRNMLFIK